MHTVASTVERHSAGEPEHRTLRRGVTDRLGGVTQHRLGDRVHHPPGIGGDEVWPCRLGHEEGADRVVVEQPAHLRLVELVHPRVVDDPRVVHDAVEPTERVKRGLHH